VDSERVGPYNAPMINTTSGLGTWSRRAMVVALPIVFALAVLLTACGGENAADTGAATTVTEPTAAATEGAAVAPTAAPTQAVATEAPPTVEPTVAPPPTAPATAETSSGDATAGLPSGNCGNPYYPVVEGRTYRYTSNLPGFGVSEYSISYSDVTDESFTATTNLGEGDTLVNVWSCSGEGLLQPEFTQLPGAVEGMTVEFVEAEGVTVPTAAMFSAGGSWTTHYVANATMPDMGAGAMTMVETIDLTNTFAGVEAVSVPAGDYPEAVRVDTTGTISVAMASAPAMDIELTFSSWYVEGVGMVRQEMTGLLDDSAPSVTELVAIEE